MSTAPPVTPLVSVIIPNFNYAAFVCDAVDSALAQSYPRLEVIVIDNGSTDDSLQVLRRYGERIRVVSQANQGQSGARNRGVAECSGSLIAFLDADDAWHPDKIARQVAAMQVRPETVLVYCGLVATDSDLRPLAAQGPRFRGEVRDDFLRRPGTAIVLGGESSALVRSEALRAAGGFAEELSISGGYDLWRRIALQGPIDYLPEPLVYYRQHGGGAHGRLAAYWRDARAASRRALDDAAAPPALRRRHMAMLDMAAGKSLARSGRAAAVPLLLRAMVTAPLTAAGVTPLHADPFPHRLARIITRVGVRGSHLCWRIAERFAPPKQGLTEPLAGVPLFYDRDDWTSRNAYRGLYERAEERVIEGLLRPGDIVVDVGANIGWTAALAARAVGPDGVVLAIEPSPRCLPALRAVAARVPTRNIQVIPVAAGPRAGIGVLSGHDAVGHAGLGSLRHGGSAGVEVPVRPLRDLLSDAEVDRIDLLKIDVEGLETEVLQGSVEWLADGRIRHALIEVSPEFAASGPLAEFLAPHLGRYDAFAVEESGHLVRRPFLQPMDRVAIAQRPKQFNLLLKLRPGPGA